MGNLKPETDEDLMRQFCQGDERAFEGLYERHARGVHAFLRRMVRDPALADDLLQTTFMSVVRARGRYETGAGVRAWFYAIATNAGRDALRRRRARPTYDSDVEPSVEPAMPDPVAARAIEQALAQLPLEQREAVLLHKLHEFSFPEIAHALGISVTAAKVRAHRGYLKLRDLLAPLGDPS